MIDWITVLIIVIFLIVGPIIIYFSLKRILKKEKK